MFISVHKIRPDHQLEETKVLSQGTDTPPNIKIGGNYIEDVQSFVYLGSNITSNASMDAEINCRIGNASDTFARLSATV